MNINIEKATLEDFPEIFEIFHIIVKTGDTVYFSPTTSFEEAKKQWMGDGIYTYKALLDKKIVGTYILKQNFPGLGSHVANGAYMVHPKYQKKKIGQQMVAHSLKELKRLGFKAIQFNFVVSTNIIAINLYKKFGFKIIGTSPKSCKHMKLGYIDVYIMHRFIE